MDDSREKQLDRSLSVKEGRKMIGLFSLTTEPPTWFRMEILPAKKKNKINNNNNNKMRKNDGLRTMDVPFVIRLTRSGRQNKKIE